MSSDKALRHQVIRQILAREPIGTQRELVARLRQRGFRVTQATVSRDLTEIGVARVPVGNGQFRYVPLDTDITRPPPSTHVRAVLQDFVIRVQGTGNLVLVKTTPSAAPVVADLIDRLEIPEVVGTVAGEDTVLVVLYRARDRIPFMQKLEGWRR